MPKVIIVEPNNTKEENDRILERISEVLSKITKQYCSLERIEPGIV